MKLRHLLTSAALLLLSAGAVAQQQETFSNPVINADGNLVGINFDRVWEGTMSDLAFDPELCRNISLDIRYVLFLIDKYAGARNILDELTLVD